MWDYTDSQLKKFKKEYERENQKTLDEFQNIFDGVKDLDGNASKEELERFKRRINNNYGYLSDYGKYQADKYLKMRKIKTSDVFWFTLFMVYAYQQYKMLKIELGLFYDIANDVYDNEKKELDRIFGSKKKLDVKNIVDKSLANANSKGYAWLDYNDAMTEYNTTELYNQVIQNIRANKSLNINSREFKKIIEKQNNRLISINGDKISGALDNETIYVANETKKELYLFYGVNKCKFIAVEDKATTRMCKSLNGQVFNVHDWNEFKRYSAVSQQIVKYRVYGMIPGVNLPPIDDHYHYCRSTITYQVEEDNERT